MSEVVEAKLPCHDCGSSDALHRYDDGHTHCFSCEKTTQPNGVGADLRAEGLLRDIDTRALPARKIYEETTKKFGYGLGTWGDQIVHVAPYYDKGRMVGQKIRTRDKDFSVKGTVTDAELFGQRLWSSGGKRLVITEGEIDAMAYAQATNRSWPVVSVPNGASGALKAIKRNLEFVESFDEVVVMFDNDDPGQKAAQQVAEFLAPGKAKIATLPRKDASDMLVEGLVKEMQQAVWNARSVRPDGIVNGETLWDEVSKPIDMGIPYPWSFLNKGSLYGMRPGEITTWVAGSGQGKSAFVAEIAYDLAVKQERPVGYVALEENCGRTAMRFMGLHLDRPIHLPGVEVSTDDREAAFKATLGTGRFWLYDHFGSLDSDNLIAKLRYLIKGCGVQCLVLDHLSIVVSGMDLDGDERRMIDHTMTALRSLTEETKANLQLVSHLKRPNGAGHEDGAITSLSQLRGSAAIAQLSDAVIGIERNQQAENPQERDVAVVRVLKNRYAGITGEMGECRYDRETGRLVQLDGKEFASPPPSGGQDDDDEIPF